MAQPSVDSEGRHALRIIIVLTPGSVPAIGGDAALDTLVQIREKLHAAGEERLPIVEYATLEELADGGGS